MVTARFVLPAVKKMCHFFAVPVSSRSWFVSLGMPQVHGGRGGVFVEVIGVEFDVEFF